MDFLPEEAKTTMKESNSLLNISIAQINNKHKGVPNANFLPHSTIVYTDIVCYIDTSTHLSILQSRKVFSNAWIIS